MCTQFVVHKCAGLTHNNLQNLQQCNNCRINFVDHNMSQIFNNIEIVQLFCGIHIPLKIHLALL